MAQMVKNLPVVQGTWVPSPGWKTPWRKGSFWRKDTHFSILAWRIPWTAEPIGVLSTGSCKESDMTEQLILWLSVLIYIFLKCKQFYKIWSHVWVCASNATIRTQTFQHAKEAHFASTLPSHFPWNIVLSNSGLIPHLATLDWFPITILSF